MKNITSLASHPPNTILKVYFNVCTCHLKPSGKNKKFTQHVFFPLSTEFADFPTERKNERTFMKRDEGEKPHSCGLKNLGNFKIFTKSSCAALKAGKISRKTLEILAPGFCRLFPD